MEADDIGMLLSEDRAASSKRIHGLHSRLRMVQSSRARRHLFSSQREESGCAACSGERPLTCVAFGRMGSANSILFNVSSAGEWNVCAILLETKALGPPVSVSVTNTTRLYAKRTRPVESTPGSQSERTKRLRAASCTRHRRAATRLAGWFLVAAARTRLISVV